MTYICYRGIEVSAALQKVLLTVELIMLVVLAVVALIKVYSGHGSPGSEHIHLGWFNPASVSFASFVSALVLMLFIYWGWDTAVSVNEETKDPAKTPGQAAILSTLLLLVTYALVIVAVLAFAGVGSKGIGLSNSANSGDVLSVLGGSIFGGGWLGTFLTRLLILMVLSSAAASTQTTILPTARTTLSMAAYKAIPAAFAKMHPKNLTPTVSTIVMGAISIVLYIPFNYLAQGNLIFDAVTAIGLYIAFYYGLTAFECVWYYRKTLTKNSRDLWMQGILPFLGGLIMYTAGGFSLWQDYDVNTGNSYTMFTVPGLHWEIGGAFMVALGAAVVGFIGYAYMRITAPAFFRKETLTRGTPTLVPDPDQ
jgi:amino acid transporter